MQLHALPGDPSHRSFRISISALLMVSGIDLFRQHENCAVPRQADAALKMACICIS